MPKTYSSAPAGERRETMACALCGATGALPFLSSAGCAFVRCRSCSLVYQDPRPVFEDLRRRYGADYFSYELENEANFFELMKLGLRDIDLDGLTEGFLRPRAFLDVGCATGMLLAWIREKGWTVQGVDLCRESAEHGTANRGVPIFAGTLEEAGFPVGSFSVAHFSHLIEHVPDPRGFMAEVRRVLAPGGFVVVTTPNIDGFQARLFREGWRSAIPDHLTLFSRRTLGRLLEESGFSVLRSVTWGGLARGTAPRFIKGPVDAMAKKWGFGDVMLFLAVRDASPARC
jgi:SAM-dependent methyltransferase